MNTHKKSEPNSAATPWARNMAANSRWITDNSLALGRVRPTHTKRRARHKAGALRDLSTSRSGVGGAERLGEPTLPPAIIGRAEHNYSRTLESSVPGSNATRADSIEDWTSFAGDNLSSCGTCRRPRLRNPTNTGLRGVVRPDHHDSRPRSGPECKSCFPWFDRRFCDWVSSETIGVSLPNSSLVSYLVMSRARELWAEPCTMLPQCPSSPDFQRRPPQTTLRAR